MPEIASAAPLLSAAPAQLVAAANVASTVPGSPVVGDQSAMASDFLGQLKAALKSLAGAVTALPAAAAPALTTPEAPAHTAKKTEKTPDEVTEVLATLGFVPVPLPTQPQTVALAAADKGSAGTTVALPIASSSVPTGAAPTTAPTRPAPPKATDTPASTAASANPSTVTPAPTRTLEPSPSQTTTPIATDTAPAASATPATTTPKVDTQQATISAATTTLAPHAAPAPTLQPQTTPQSSPLLTTAAIQPHVQASTDGSFQQGSDSGDAHTRHGSNSSGLTSDTASSSTQTAAPDQTFAASVASASASASATPAALPANVHPGEVASQIAHQADLYRLPGNKGVRIQLHPDDLGGVQVTVRYAAGGALELHINVEHASTGALVQAGWTELRDALATQGISPDRLVMSVTGPSSSAGSNGQMDFSSNGNSYRSSDSSLTGSGGESGQQRQDGAPADDSRATRRWGTLAESNTSTSADETPRAPASRIDYRV